MVIWVSGEPSGPQLFSPSFKVIKKNIFMPKKGNQKSSKFPLYFGKLSSTNPSLKITFDPPDTAPYWTVAIVRVNSHLFEKVDSSFKLKSTKLVTLVRKIYLFSASPTTSGRLECCRVPKAQFNPK